METAIGTIKTASITNVRDRLMEMTKKITDLSFGLHPTALELLGFATAIKRYTERFSNETGLGISIECRGLGGRYVPEIESAVFGVIHQALSKIVAHAGDNAAHVEVWAYKRQIGVSISDNGNGFDPEPLPEKADGRGMTEMRERAVSVSGKLTVGSSLGAGVTVLPMSKNNLRAKKRA